jgi:hypothetical protein
LNVSEHRYCHLRLTVEPFMVVIWRCLCYAAPSHDYN